ncbi:response regulator transcription factor [Chryseobacterium sp. POL2]|uniref:response regulator transcription factor n=1 Tax=Chryseobacterium TaxID=59732 RepID=UPI0013E19A32|nr:MULTISPECIES: response regulator transcription factor [Chryseobacterium]MDM1554248.1 response regulator transcription factor [Chryseobacterium indologenes]QIG89670.1 response regulator transcription factor [Chryseobacterium sp. POL2]
MDTGNKTPKNSIAFINDKSPLIDIACNDLIASGIEILFRSENVQDGLSQLSALSKLPKAIIIDLKFHDNNVLAQLRELKAKYPSIGLIAYGDGDTDETVQALMEIGIKSYLLIGSDTDDFKRAIEKV